MVKRGREEEERNILMTIGPVLDHRPVEFCVSDLYKSPKGTLHVRVIDFITILKLTNMPLWGNLQRLFFSILHWEFRIIHQIAIPSVRNTNVQLGHSLDTYFDSPKLIRVNQPDRPLNRASRAMARFAQVTRAWWAFELVGF